MRPSYLYGTLLVALTLAGCVAASPIATPSAEDLHALSNANATQSANLATQSVIIAIDSTQQYAQAAAQATAVAVYTQAESDRRLQVTADYMATQSALSLTPYAATAESIAATVAAVHAASTQDAIMAVTAVKLTAQAIENTQEYERTRLEQAQQRERNETNAQSLAAFIPACLGLAAALSATLAAGLIAYAVTLWLERTRINSHYKITPTGDYLIIPTNDGSYTVMPVNVERERIPAPPVLPLLSAPDVAELSEDGMDDIFKAQAAGHLAFYPNKETMQSLSADQRLLRRDLLLLLTESIAVNGKAARIIPRYSNLPSWAKRPKHWTRLTDYLVAKAYAVKVSGPPPAGGTHLTGNWTLYSLLSHIAADRTVARARAAASASSEPSSA